ncbi:MAG: class I SAM-dependent RNA methyltransferase [Geodermatophilaceae bacterium]
MSEDLLDLEVGAVAHGGHCVARHEGRVVFVRHALPGERVLARITEDGGGSYCRADAVRVLRASSARVAPPCRFAGAGRCGGCDFQHVDPAEQRRLKAAVVAEQLTRLGGLPDVAVEVEELPGGALGWRTRMQFAVDRSGRPGLRRHRSHDVEHVDDCVIAHPDLVVSEVLGRSWGATREVDVVRAGGSRTVLRRPVRGAVKLIGPGSGRVEAAGRGWRVSAGGFWQVHPAAADVLARCVLDFAGVGPGERCLDLYAGAGLFGGVLAPVVGPSGSVLCVESDEIAVADALVNLDGMGWAGVRRARVDAALIGGLAAYDVAVLDPPRSGAGREIVQALTAGPARAVVYVACDPAALARDVATFRQAGWRLDRLRAFDCYPMTHHVECVALLTPGSSVADPAAAPVT